MGNTNSYHTDGIHQEDRYPPALRPAFFQVEERDADDLLMFVAKLASQFNYYNINNAIEGNWEDFFLSDVNIMTRVFVRKDVNNFLRKYDALKDKLIKEVEEKELLGTLQQIMEYIYNFAFVQLQIHEKFKKSATTHNFEGLKEFRKIIEGYDVYDGEINRIMSFYEEAEREFGNSFKLKHVDELKRLLDVQGDTDYEPVFRNGTTVHEKILGAINYIDELFSSLGLKYNRLIDASVYYLHKQKAETITYAPHIGLMMSFLDLYQNLKNGLNQFTQKHLEFFYKRVLGIEQKNAIADKVNIIFELNPGIKQFQLSKGEQLLASIPGQVAKDIFELDEDILITRTKIIELKTVYVSENVKIRSKDEDIDDVKEFKVYSSNNTVPETADFLKAINGSVSWPVLGEDQSELPKESLSMDEAEIGLVVASPILYAVDGKRSFKIRFYMSEDSFAGFYQHALDFAQLSGINEQVVIYEMLNKAFIVDITTKDQWLRIKKYVTSCSLDKNRHQHNKGQDKFIEIEFELNANDPAIGIYSPEIHGSSYDSKWPMVRMLLNNNSFYNPYTFFNGIVLERITINVAVFNSEQVKLQNNIGPLSPANPFQLYGPQPTVGSYIDIKNTNIFNKFCKDFTIRLNWFNLPKEKGGFETYYEGYSGHITNESFKLAISGLNEGRFIPEHEEQQVFNMFSMRKTPGLKQYLSPLTKINHIDFGKVRFANEPTLEQEENVVNELHFKDGAVRLELVAPNDPFGHKEYPIIFPKVIMNNAKRFVKKLPTPNQPYIPVTRSITVDYKLEYSEVLVGSKKESVAKANICLWHYSPFGYKQVYPRENSLGATLIPSVEYEGNLYIGLSELVPDKELVFLFQLEEENFLQVENETEKIQWSYLYDNEWIKIDPLNVLEDNTFGFISTGTIKLRIPSNIVSENTVLNPDLYWLRASCGGYVRSRVKGVFTQVGTATRKTDLTNSATQMSLLPGAIKEFARKIPQVATVIQPFPSYDGRSAETVDEYYVRVSEQLHHKQRLLTADDISKKILEVFPEIHRVICYNSSADEALAGSGQDMQVVIIPRIKNLAQLEQMNEPKVNLATLYSIRRFLSKFLSPFLKVEICNPVYEKIKVVCSVVFNENKNRENNGNYIQMLNADLRKFISPWTVSVDEDIKNKGGLYPSEILNFIKKCPYVSYVTGFTVLHFYKEYNKISSSFEARLMDSSQMKIRFLKGSGPGAILISSDAHDITVLDEPGYKKSPKIGIGGLVIGNELLIDVDHDANSYTSSGTVEAIVEDDNIEIQFNHNL